MKYKSLLILASTAFAILPPSSLLATEGQGVNRRPIKEPGHWALALNGVWRFQLDPNDVGESEQWFNTSLPDQIKLPGTTDLANKGYALDKATMRYPTTVPWQRWHGRDELKRMDQAGFLVRDHLFVGKAWYQKTVEVPQSWAGKHVRLRLERVMWQSQVWIDGRAVGSNDSLVAAHHYDLGTLQPGKHQLTLCVDNRLIHNIGLIGHAYGSETQTRWNGVIGEIELTATSPVFIRDVQVYPTADRQTVRVRVAVENKLGKLVRTTLRTAVQPERKATQLGRTESTISLKPGEQIIEQLVEITQPVEVWDEFSTTRYRLIAAIESNDRQEMHSTLFGFRDIERDGRHIRINGQRIFMRGTLDCCVYPKTGHPPVTVEAWLQVLGTIKEYGFNHVRFHTWCPPEAAFEAADQLGLYLAPETPFWVNDRPTENSGLPQLLGHDPEVTDYLRREIQRISKAYGNHPSFAMFCIGNEFGNQGTDWDVAEQLLAEVKQYDPRRLYNASTARKRIPSDDFWVTHYSGKGTRGIGPAHTNWDFSAASEATDLPVIAHETGQRPVFPDYDDLLPKFTGPLKPYNLQRFRDQLVHVGLDDQVKDFERASAKFQLLQYKAEHEGMLRTPDYAGYQLLMLNDFPGQSEALVGILDPFWQSKGIVSSQQICQWNSPTVPLARFDRYTWTTNETFEAMIEVAHFGPIDLSAASAHWTLAIASGDVTAEDIIAKGKLGPLNVKAGGLTAFGKLKVPLRRLSNATELTLKVTIGNASNQWTVWAYPPSGVEPDAGEVLITRRFDETAKQALAGGGRVLLVAQGLKNQHVAKTTFSSAYWSAGWWGNRFSSLGIVCEPRHPALASFPNAGHSDWQWFGLTNGATTFDLTEFERGQRPIVQGVTDFHHNRLLAQVFELRIGKGKLLVCGYDLTTNLATRHAARQFRRSLLGYMNSGEFKPQQQMRAQEVKELLSSQ